MRAVQVAAAVTGAAVFLAAPASADVVDDYATQTAAAICQVLDEWPTVIGVMGLGEAITEQSDLTPMQAGEAIGIAVARVCPRHTGLMEAVADAYLPIDSVVVAA